MEKLLVIVFIGLTLLGNTFAEFESSGDDGNTYDEEYESESADGPLGLCEQKRLDYQRTKEGYEPRCLNDGQFSPRQCSKGICWCVDKQGMDIPGSKGLTDCSAYTTDDFSFGESSDTKTMESENKILDPGVLAGIIGGVVVCLLCAVLIVMFIVYRMKKKDEGSYILGRAERKNSRSVIYTKAVPRDQEFYA